MIDLDTIARYLQRMSLRHWALLGIMVINTVWILGEWFTDERTFASTLEQSLWGITFMWLLVKGQREHSRRNEATAIHEAYFARKIGYKEARLRFEGLLVKGQNE